jgi:hypothetical protein
MDIKLEQLKAAILAKGYSWFETGDYNLNIIGIRNTAIGNKVTNLFDDWIACAYKVNSTWQLHYWEATTDPGKMGVQQFHNPQGVARLVEGQYGKSHVIGLHQGKYEALCQIAPLSVYRDANRNLEYDGAKAAKYLNELPSLTSLCCFARKLLNVTATSLPIP